MHKQVKYKDFEVDEEMLPVIKKLNENGLETVFSCCGLDEDLDKDKPAYKLNKRIYTIIKDTYGTSGFIKALLMLQYRYMKQGDSSSTRLPLIEVSYDYYEEGFRYTLVAVNSCTLNTYSFFIDAAIDLWRKYEEDKEKIWKENYI